ncbi:O-antigen ligase family protein [Psychromonas sp. MB-3u-54]|uniref:O-antigen ligase family protein n=1 Tax=Psychromonas sp. MB-3u-54 TaxID=2058319 RepID=UPI0012FF3E0D|nr:O-antigen ligase family protein [Psychromonas sp. MB-3u-54]
MLHRKLPLISNALIFLFSATLLLSGKSYSYIAITLCLVSLLALPITLKHKLPSDVYKIGLALSGYFFVTALSVYWYGGKTSNMDMPSRTILILPALIFLLSSPPKKEWVFRGILVGSFLSGLIALYHTQILHIRAFMAFEYMVIQAGDMAMSLGVFSLLIAVHYLKEKNKHLALLALVCAILGILASLLSGVRGGWLLSPFVMLGFLIINRHLISKKIAISMIFFSIVIGVISYQTVAPRVNLALDNFNQFSEENNANTSTGARIEMWKSGLYAFTAKPIFGIGYQNRQSFNQALVDNNLVDPIVLRFNRLHNSFIEELSIKGIIGLTALMAFFLVPMYFFLRRGNIKHDIFTQLGVAHIILVMGYCLTQNYINHHSGMLQYLMFTIIFYAMLYNENDNSLSTPTDLK